MVQINQTISYNLEIGTCNFFDNEYLKNKILQNCLLNVVFGRFIILMTFWNLLKKYAVQLVMISILKQSCVIPFLVNYKLIYKTLFI